MSDFYDRADSFSSNSRNSQRNVVLSLFWRINSTQKLSINCKKWKLTDFISSSKLNLIDQTYFTNLSRTISFTTITNDANSIDCISHHLFGCSPCQYGDQHWVRRTLIERPLRAISKDEMVTGSDYFFSSWYLI